MIAYCYYYYYFLVQFVVLSYRLYHSIFSCFRQHAHIQTEPQTHTQSKWGYIQQAGAAETHKTNYFQCVDSFVGWEKIEKWTIYEDQLTFIFETYDVFFLSLLSFLPDIISLANKNRISLFVFELRKGLNAIHVILFFCFFL